MSNPKTMSHEEVFRLLAKVATERGRWELANPGACYVCSTANAKVYHDYDKGCPRLNEE